MVYSHESPPTGERGAGIIGWIDVDALHLPGVFVLQRFQGQEVVPVDEHIFCVQVGGGVSVLRQI